MANLIRLKQVESGSLLQASADIGNNFSASVNQVVSQSLETTLSQSIVNIIVNNVGAVLPDGVVSGSSQVLDILQPLNQFTASLGDTFATDYEVYVTTSNIIDQGEW